MIFTASKSWAMHKVPTISEIATIRRSLQNMRNSSRKTSPQDSPGSTSSSTSHTILPDWSESRTSPNNPATPTPDKK